MKRIEYLGGLSDNCGSVWRDNCSCNWTFGWFDMKYEYGCNGGLSCTCGVVRGWVWLFKNGGLTCGVTNIFGCILALSAFKSRLFLRIKKIHTKFNI